MTDPRDLLRARGAPAPLARPMPTEIRSDGGLGFKLLQAPYWSGPDSAPVIAEWTCALSLWKMIELRDFLVKPDPKTGIQPEAAIDALLRATGIGHFMGTFIAAGPTFNQVRFMFAFAPKYITDPRSLNRAIFNMLKDGRGPDANQGARDLLHLRGIWAEAATRTDDVLMMLSQIDLVGQLHDPDQSPFSAALLPPLTDFGGVP